MLYFLCFRLPLGFFTTNHDNFILNFPISQSWKIPPLFDVDYYFDKQITFAVFNTLLILFLAGPAPFTDRQDFAHRSHRCRSEVFAGNGAGAGGPVGP